MSKIILPEIVSVGIYNAQLAIKDRPVSKNRKTTMFEIELPIGTGGVSYIDDTAHPITENLLICAKPGQIRHTRLPYKCYYIHIIVTEGALLDTLSALPNYLELGDTSEFRKIFLSLCDHYNTGIARDEIYLQSMILKLTYLLNLHAPNTNIKHSPKSNNHTAIEQTLAYINANLSSQLDLNTLAGEVKFSPVYFHKLFKASTGKTLHEYVEQQRIKKSADLLLSTDMTLAQIAYECGFSSQSYFSFAFKRNMGITPRAYAKYAAEKYNIE